MKLVITGATGFLGRNLSEHFHRAGMSIVATGRSPEVGKALRQQGITFHQADITDYHQLSEAFSTADCVIHCAAQTGDWGRYKDFYSVNVLGTRYVIRASLEHGINKIIFISTPSIYFNGLDRYDIAESDPLPTKQFSYGKTKLIAENDLLALNSQGIKTMVLRPRAVYGRYDNTIVPRILQLSEKKKFPLINDGRALVDITYVGNFISAVEQCLAAPAGVWNEAYNITNGNPISIKDWFGKVLAIFERPFNPENVPELVAKTMAGIMELTSLLPFGNKTPALTRWSVGYMAKSMTMSIDKAREKLNYSPKISNEQGFKEFAEWYRS